MKRRLLPILMTLVLVCALPIWAAFVTSGDVTNPLVSTAGATLPDLQAKIDAAADNATITLDSDTTITETLVITSKTLTLDLNGCTLRMTGTSSVLKVSGRATLTITDSSAAKSGTITGGNAEDGDGGGVCVEAYATLEMTGGCITGCRAEDGGGVYIDNNATLKMTGGCITDCHASYGGGIYSYGNLYMGGTAKIEKCTSNGGSYDAIWNKGGDMYADGGTVDGTVNNQGTIKHSNGVTAVTVFKKAVYNQQAGTIEAGMYNETVENNGTIIGGTFYGAVTIRKGSWVWERTGSISGGTFYSSIVNEAGPERVTGVTFAVTFDRGDGTKTEPTPVKYNDLVPKPTAPTKSGYTFTGWEDANGAYDFNTPVTGPLTLTAKWEKVPSSGGYYYYQPTTDTKTTDTKGSPKTADPGVALYAALSLLSLTGLTCTTKKR
ncbi:MAG: InlB B-repeat-containing protein [Oscillospiraceae bacterium]